MPISRNPPRLQFTFTPTGKFCHAHLWSGPVVRAEGIIEVHTKTGPKTFEWGVLVSREEEVHPAFDRHVQDRARAMGWQPA